MIQRGIGRLRRLEQWEKTLYMMFVAQFTSAVGFSMIFPFLPLYVQEIGSTQGWSLEFAVGLVASVQGFTMMLTSPIWGVLADRYGRKLMVQRAAFGGAILILWMGFARSAEELVLIRFIQGGVTGVVSAANALVAGQAPRSQSGFAMGVIQVGLWSGVAIGPLIGGVLADAFGYRTAFIVTAVLLGAAGVLVWFGVQENFTPPKKDKKQSSNMVADWGRVLTTPGVGITYFLRFMSNMARMGIFPILPLFLVTIMATSDRVNTVTGLMIGVTAAASTATAIYLGRLGDRIGHRKVVRGSALVAGLVYLPQSLVTEPWQLFVLQGIAGAAAGGILPALSALLARYTEPGEEGNVFGIDNSIGSAGRAVSPLISTSVAYWFGLRSTFLVTGAMFLCIMLLAIWKLPKSIPKENPASSLPTEARGRG